MIEVYRGSANTWECDEMGHMNVRFYLSRMMEGLMELAHVVGMPHAFGAQARSTLAPRDQNIRYMREAKAGESLTMTAQVVDVADSSVLIFQRMDHADGRTCATYTTWVDHIDISANQPFPWAPKVKEAWLALKAETPDGLGPRSLQLDAPPAKNATVEIAEELGAPVIGRCVVQPTQCDLRGRMLPEFFIGRVSDSVGHLLKNWREQVADAARARGETITTGGAVLEARWVYRAWPAAGDRIVIRSGLGFIDDKTHSIVHWLLDPTTGQAWATCQVVAITFDLAARKIVPTTPEAAEALKKLIPSGLAV
ncbi:MAG: thioesterase family protein [Hyphomonadaceae bacterium]